MKDIKYENVLVRLLQNRWFYRNAKSYQGTKRFIWLVCRRRTRRNTKRYFTHSWLFWKFSSWIFRLLYGRKDKIHTRRSKERDATYATRLHVKVRLINRETGEIKEQEIYLGDFPLMTDSGTFVINGAERVVVSQLVRSPGCYYAKEFDPKTGKRIYTSTVMPIRGAWLEYETDGNDVFYVRVDRTRKLPVTSLLRAIGIATDEQIIALFGEEPKITATIQKDTVKTPDEALIEIYKN